MLQAVEGGSVESAGMGPAFTELTGHLSAAHAQFLAHWLRLVDLEEGDSSAKRSEIWAMPGAPLYNFSSASPYPCRLFSPFNQSEAMLHARCFLRAVEVAQNF